MEEPVGYPIGYVSLATGLSTHLLRAWERRYNAITPIRSENGRRRYCNEDIERLRLLKTAVASGVRISTIAALDNAGLKDRLNQQTGQPPAPASEGGESAPAVSSEVQNRIDTGLAAVDRLDGAGLRRVLQAASVDLNRQMVIDAVISPLMQEVGARWAKGRMRIVHGHLAANIVQACLERMLEAPQTITADRPRMLIAAPAGQWCYLGALAVAVTAQDHGWAPALVGANLPSEEIAAACDIIDPQIVVLSITCRIDDAYMHGEVQRLAHYIGDRCPVIAGGRAAPRYRDSIAAGGGIVCETTEHLLSLLQ